MKKTSIFLDESGIMPKFALGQLTKGRKMDDPQVTISKWDFDVNSLLPQERRTWKRRRNALFKKLKKGHCFWSYDPASVTEIDDDTLIELVLLHLDVPDIYELFMLFSDKHIKRVWLSRLVPLGERCFPLNCFIACAYFHVKNPRKYVKTMATKQLKRRLNT